MKLQLENMTALASHLAVPNAFETRVVLDMRPAALGWTLHERRLAAPLRKDYDALEDPAEWPRRFDTARWAILGATHDGKRIGGAIAATRSRGVDMLEGRTDLVVVWDLRVAPAWRQRGVGTALLAAVEQWSRERAATELKVETQNVNPAACCLYRACGFRLAQATPGAYPDLQEEVQLIWRKPVTREGA